MLKIGRLLLLSHGAYSSYGREGWFVVVQPFDPDAELKSYLAANPTKDVAYRFDHREFLSWVIGKGLLIEVEEFFDEWHLGDYGQASEVKFLPRSPDTRS